MRLVQAPAALDARHNHSGTPPLFLARRMLHTKMHRPDENDFSERNEQAIDIPKTMRR